MAHVSVVIVNYNGREYLGELLESLARQVRPADEVIVVDNASNDGSVDFLQRNFPGVKIIELPHNVGFAEGNNIGVAKACGECIALLNNDTVVNEGWLGELVRTLESDGQIGAVVPKIYRAHSYPKLDCAGAEFNNLGFTWGRGANQIDRGQFEMNEEVPALTGCSVLLRRSALDDDRVFDGNFFMYYEELDLSLRLRGRGYSIVYVPTAIVQHKVSQGISQVAPKPTLLKQFYATRNRLKILLKYYPVSLLVRNLPLNLIGLIYWNAYFLRHGGPRFASRALKHQVLFARAGIAERHKTRRVRAERWIPWMKQQGIRDILSLRATFKEG